MEKVELKATLRESSGKGVARSLRRQGAIPAVLYSAGKSTLLAMNSKELLLKLGKGRREGVLLALQIEGKAADQGERMAILREMQWDPVDGALLHIDLFEVSMDKPIRVQAPLKLMGTPAGVKDGGILQSIMREVEIECLPSLIPEYITIDASSLGIGAHFYVRDLQVPEGIVLLQDGDQAILSISAPVSEAKLEELLTATPAETGKEPELVKKPTKEEELAEGKEGKEAKKEEKA
jgi:large subunit ribosomal protein L25